MRVKFLAQGHHGSLGWGSNPWLTAYKSDMLPTAPRHYVDSTEQKRFAEMFRRK